MALDFPVGSDFPANGNQIPDGHEYSGFYWDATVGVWKRVCDGGERYLLAHGDEVLDCDDPVEYKWNEALSFATTAGDINIDAPIDDNEKVNRTIEDDDDIKQITNKEYVDVKDEELRQGIIELEEEIDAIAPSVEYGTWEWANPANNPRPPAAGTFHLLDATGALTIEYKDTKFIKIHNDEYLPPGSTDPVDTHTWADADPGKLIQLFDRADPDFLLGEIVTTTPDTDSVLIEVQLIQTSGVPNDNAVGGVYLSRINIFAAPSGGAAGDFVKIIGDTMTGDLEINRSAGGPTSTPGAAGRQATLRLKGDRTGTTDAVASIKFDNAASSYAGFLSYRSGSSNSQFFKFNQNVEFSDKNLTAINEIDVKSTIKRLGHERFSFQNGGAGLNLGSIIAHRPSDGKRGFTIQGKEQGSGDDSKDLFFSYSNSGSGGDSIDYLGICTSNNHIMNRNHGDSRFVQTGTKGIKITKNGSTYYIQGG